MTDGSVLVVFTGGTIGTRLTADVMGLAPGQTRLLLTAYDGSQFDVHEPLSLLSENARPSDWTAIVGAVAAAVRPHHTGVIVTHGTDTLSYGAHALAFGLCRLNVPIALVASNRPLDDPEANGHTNFRDALDLISRARRGVYVTFRNPDGRRLVHLASRVQPSTPISHSVHSIGEASVDQPPAETPEPDVVLSPARFSERVLYLRPHPGLDYDAIDLGRFDAVVHETYHSGTACTVGTGTNVLDFAGRCGAAGVPVFLGPVPDDVGTYESATGFAAARIIPFRRMLSETAYVKVALGVGIGLVGDTLVDFVCRQELAGEFVR